MSPQRRSRSLQVLAWAILALLGLGVGLGLLLSQGHTRREEANWPAPLDRSLEGPPRFTVSLA